MVVTGNIAFFYYYYVLVVTRPIIYMRDLPSLNEVIVSCGLEYSIFWLQRGKYSKSTQESLLSVWFDCPGQKNCCDIMMMLLTTFRKGTVSPKS